MRNFALFQININTNVKASALIAAYPAPLPELDSQVQNKGNTEPPQDKGSTDLVDWITGIYITCVTDPYMTPVKGYIVNMAVAHGVQPGLATTFALVIVSAVVCAAPALLRKLVKLFR